MINGTRGCVVFMGVEVQDRLPRSPSFSIQTTGYGYRKRQSDVHADCAPHVASQLREALESGLCDRQESLDHFVWMEWDAHWLR